MAINWIKSNWAILTVVVGTAVYMVQADRDTKNNFANVNSSIADIKNTAKDRAEIADGRYAEQDKLNLASRMQAVESQQRDMLILIQRIQERSELSSSSIMDKLQALSIQVSVVTSKVDDLRAPAPRKTSFGIGPVYRP